MMNQPVILCVDDEQTILRSLKTELKQALSTRYLLLTGQADSEAIERSQHQSNLHRCLYKPWNVKELIETIKSG